MFERDYDGVRTAGFQGVANALSTETRPVSRQQVYAWWTRRDRNGFPAQVEVQGRLVFVLEDVTAWYAGYEPARGGRPRKEGTT